MMKKYIFVLIFAMPFIVNAECVLRSTTVAHSVAVAERGQVESVMVRDLNGEQKCVVSFRARVESDWHIAHGEAQDCEMAIRNAERDLLRTLGPTQFQSEDIMICNDSPNLQQLTDIRVGTTGNIEQFRPHPEFPGSFRHMNTECRWIMNVVFDSRLRNYEGIVCRTTAGNQWTVVDLF